MMIQRSAKESGNAAHLSGENLMEEGQSGRRRDFWTVLDAGYEDAKIIMADGRIPCAVAVMTKKQSSQKNNDFREGSAAISSAGQKSL